jgi:hypothetical protein
MREACVIRVAETGQAHDCLSKVEISAPRLPRFAEIVAGVSSRCVCKNKNLESHAAQNSFAMSTRQHLWLFPKVRGPIIT